MPYLAIKTMGKYGSFGKQALPYNIDRNPKVPSRGDDRQGLRTALEKENGFFLMVEEPGGLGAMPTTPPR